jgi:hypothetical protein
MRVTRLAVALSVVIAVAAPPAARAQEPVLCLPNQSVAVLDQYCDALITPGGSSAPIGSRGGGKPLSTVLPAKEVSELRKAGRAGQALLTLTVTPTAPAAPGAPTTARVRRRMAAARRAVQPEQLKPPATDVVSITSGVVSVGGDVLGGAFRWGLVICTLGLAGMTWLRFRTRLKL